MPAQPLQTFHLFPKLPTELQMHIFKLACLPESPGLFRNGLIIDHALYQRSISPRWRLKSLFYAVRLVVKDMAFRTRHTLLRTSRLARLIALEAWKEDIMEIEVPGPKLQGLFGRRTQTPEGARWKKEQKMEMVREIEGLIEDVKGRLDEQ